MTTARAKTVRTEGRARQRAATVTKVVDAAESLLAEGHVFASISVEQVISRAGVARSTFYVHFDDMGHVLRALGEGVVTEVLGSARRWMDIEGEVTRERLELVMAGLISTYLKREKLLAALAEASATDTDVRDEFHRLLRVGHVELAKHIARGVASGVVRGEIDPEPTAGWLVWMIERGLYQQIRVVPPAEVGRHIDALTTIVWNVLYDGVAQKTAR